MRFYSIIVTNPNTGAVVHPSSASAGTSTTATYSSALANGGTDLGALNVEFDIGISSFAQPYGSCYVRVWGISLQEIGQASDLNNFNIDVYGGMAKGLPLANPAQQGLLVSGRIQQAYGNWIGTDMTLDFQISTGRIPLNLSTSGRPNLTQNWKAGTQLGTAIANTLAIGFPGYTSNIQVSPQLVLAHDEPGFWGSLNEFALYINAVSLNIINGPQNTPTSAPKGYSGVSITLRNKVFSVYDNYGNTSAKNPPLAISFFDLIGQPTWLDFATVQITCVLRGDLYVGQYLTLPVSQVTSAPSAPSPFGTTARQKAVFQGTFMVKAIRHVGNFRSADGSAWVTVVDLTSQAAYTTAQGPKLAIQGAAPPVAA